MIFLMFACSTTGKDTSLHNQPSLSVTGRVVELFGGEGLTDVDVCLTQTSSCTQTDSDGHYTLEVATQTDHVLELSSPDLVGGALAFSAQDLDMELANVSLLSPALSEGQFSTLNQTWETNTGVLAFSISNGINGDGINIPNVAVDLLPQSGDGPFYSNALGIPVDDLTATSDNGGGVVINLPQGNYQLTYENLPDNCEVLLGWGTLESHQIPILTDRVSFARLTCPE